MEDKDDANRAEELHCAVCGRELTPPDLCAVLGGGLLLCGYCRAQEESCGCSDDG